MGDEEAQPEFRQWYDRALDVGPAGNQAFFGRDVLAGLVQGIRDFREHRQQRWDQYHGPGATLLGCAMWMDDPELLDELARLQAACVVVSKQARDKKVQPPDLPYKLRRLADLNTRTPGLPVCYFPPLEQLTSLVDGEPPMIGPGWSLPPGDAIIPTVRTIGFRKGVGANGSMPPILHAKLALLGRLWEHDEDDFGPADVTAFTPKRLWIGSANFTASSRRSLEFGFWTEDPRTAARCRGIPTGPDRQLRGHRPGRRPAPTGTGATGLRRLRHGGGGGRTTVRRPRRRLTSPHSAARSRCHRSADHRAKVCGWR